MTAVDWVSVEGNVKTITDQFEQPLGSLSGAEIPALVLRRAYRPEQCPDLVRRFIERGLMRDPEAPVPPDSTTRTDIGTSLGNYGDDPDAFFEHAAGTNTLFANLFEGFDNPVAAIYQTLAALAAHKTIKTAREPDGRLYGQAIFRVHYESHAYRPHFDHVTLREKRFAYDVTRFDHQLAGVICIQNADEKEAGTQAVLHDCLWTPEIQPHISEETFPRYAAANGIRSCRVELQPGDLYFFNTRCIHEVPAVRGTRPRIVLAVFIGYSDDDEEVFVWS